MILVVMLEMHYLELNLKIKLLQHHLMELAPDMLTYVRDQIEFMKKY